MLKDMGDRLVVLLAVVTLSKQELEQTKTPDLYLKDSSLSKKTLYKDDKDNEHVHN